MNIGVPAGLAQTAMRLAQLLFATFITGLGTAAYAAYQVCITALSIAYMPGSAFAVAATTIVGQGLGMRFFTDDVAVIATGTLPLRVAALAMPGLAASMVFSSGLGGADELRYAAFVVTKKATPDPVQAGTQLTYTLCVTNTSNVTLTVTVTDLLPPHVTPGGVFTWMPAPLQPDDMWTEMVVVTVEQGYSGTLDNVTQVAIGEGLTDAYTRTVTVKEVLVGLSAINDSPTVLGEITTLTATVMAGSNVSYTWAFDDGTFGNGSVVSHTYPAVGVYTAVVTASNSAGELTATTRVTVTEPGFSIYLPLVVKSH